jgi:hypothetical protein
MTLKRRLERLETRLGAYDERTIVFITAYEAGDGDANVRNAEIYKIIVLSRPGSPAQTFERLSGETEAAFRVRARVDQDDRDRIDMRRV